LEAQKWEDLVRAPQRKTIAATGAGAAHAIAAVIAAVIAAAVDLAVGVARVVV
jgi:hypothetical protein